MKYFLLISAIFFITCKSTPEVGVKYKPENSYLRLDINENKAFVIGVSIPSSKKNLAVCFDQTNIFRHKTESGLIIIEKNKDSYAFIFESKDLYVKGEMKILPILFSDCFEKLISTPTLLMS